MVVAKWTMQLDDQEEIEHSMAVAGGGGDGSCSNHSGMDRCSRWTMTCLVCWQWEWIVGVLCGNARKLF